MITLLHCKVFPSLFLIHYHNPLWVPISYELSSWDVLFIMGNWGLTERCFVCFCIQLLNKRKQWPWWAWYSGTWIIGRWATICQLSQFFQGALSPGHLCPWPPFSALPSTPRPILATSAIPLRYCWGRILRQNGHSSVNYVWSPPQHFILPCGVRKDTWMLPRRYFGNIGRDHILYT